MSSVAHVPQDPLPIGPRPAPRALGGHLTAWLRANLFASIPSSIMTLLLLFLLGKACIGLWQWGIANAVWIVSGSDTSACRALRGVDACWPVVP